jgi:ligand-binding sensor domain-containing protein
VAALAVDPGDGSIWAGCLLGTGGLAHVVGSTITKYVPVLPAIPNVLSVVAAPSGRIWFGTDAGIGRARERDAVGIRGRHRRPALAPGAHGDAWVGTGTRGLGRFDSGTTAFFSAGPPSNSILGLFADPAGVLWVGTTAGLARYEGAPWLSVTGGTLGLPNLAILSALRDRPSGAPGDSVDGLARPGSGCRTCPSRARPSTSTWCAASTG